MNADGQKSHLLLGRRDWGGCATVEGLALGAVWDLPIQDRPGDAPGWDDERNELTLAPQLVIIPPTPGEAALAPSVRRAAAADANGNVYWIGDDASQLFVRSKGDGSTSRFWPDPRAARPSHAVFGDAEPIPVAPAPYRAIAATDDGWLIAATDGGLESFDLLAGGPPLRFVWPAGEAKTATDLEARSTGLWLLDGPAKRLFELDATLSISGAAMGAPQPDLFQPVTGDPHASADVVVPAGRDLGALDPSIDPIAIAPLRDGALAVLSRNPALLFVLPADGATPPDPLELDFTPHDMIYAKVLLRGGERAPRLMVAGGVGNQLWAFQVVGEGPDVRLVETTESFPLRRYGGRALVSVNGDACYDSGPVPQWTRAVEKPRQRFATAAVLLSPVLDGRTPQVVWDRLRLDGCIPPGSRVGVEARVSDEPGLTGPWIPQPEPLLSWSGNELAGHSSAAVVATDRLAQHGTFELLFQRIQGRFLQLRLTLTSDGDSSPRLRAVRASWPRVSWAERYLPAFYREDPEPGDFLDRFLANMQGTTSLIENRMITAQTLFDTRTAPLETLGWLAEWLDVALDPTWKEPRRRAFIAHAVTFFGWRGTMRGVESALALTFGQGLDNTLFGDGGCDCPTGVRIVESYSTRTLGRIGAGDSSGIADPATHDAGLQERDRWVQFQAARGRATPMTTLPRLSVPPAYADDWAAFLDAPSHDRDAWQRLLSGRYRRIAALRDAHGAGWQSFDEISLNDTDAATDAGRADWDAFEKTLLPIDRTAHRFSVLLPVSAADATDSATLADRAALARRIVAIEKPAHTVFDIRFYFAMNRIGEARLGYDTTIGAGSRAPELLPPAILGRAYIGESFVGPDGPDLTPDRARLSC